MNKSKKLINKVIEYINKTIELKPQYTREMLVEENGSVIFYMNGNDGTNFDWGCNGHTCEFMVFFKETDLGFIKVFVNDNDTIDGYLYESDYKFGDDVLALETLKLEEGEAQYIAALMYRVADCKGKYDNPLSSLDLDYELTENELEKFADYNEEW